MKIQAINTTFRGQFTNASYKNNNDWRMEYRPYSWEKNPNGKYGMAIQEEWSTRDKTLPDNEKKFVNNTDMNLYGSMKGRKYCQDIFGTEFYYCDYDKNSERKVITEMPAMNLEESLSVRNAKLALFLNEKNKQKIEDESTIQKYHNEVNTQDSNYHYESRDYEKGWLERAASKDTDKNYMDIYHAKAIDAEHSLNNTVKKYIELRDSIDSVNAEVAKNKEELLKIENAKVHNALIDISQRDIYDPNKALWEALQDIKAAAGKLIALPHRTISMKELISKIGKVADSEIASKGIKIVDELISSRL